MATLAVRKRLRLIRPSDPPIAYYLGRVMYLYIEDRTPPVPAGSMHMRCMSDSLRHPASPVNTYVSSEVVEGALSPIFPNVVLCHYDTRGIR